MRSTALALASLLCACKPASSTPPPAAPDPAAQESDAAMLRVAERLDPGAQTPLYATLPVWLKERVEGLLGEEPRGDAVAAAAREAITAWDKVKLGDTASMLAGGLQLLRGVVLAERSVAAGSSDPELLAALAKAYRIIEQLAMFKNAAFFNEIYQVGIQLARKEGKLETQQIEEVVALLGKAIERAPALHKHTAARLLREHPRHPTALEALARIGQSDLEAERYAEAVEARRLVVLRKGARASADEHVDLAATCYRALDVACGDAARDAARTRGPDDPGDAKKVEALQKRLANIDDQAAQAREIIALAAATSLEERSRRAHLLAKLSRNGDAEALFTELRAAYPNDARPLTGLAILAIQRRMDFKAASALARAGRTLPGRDQPYYEIALGTLPLVLITDLLGEAAEAPEKLIPAARRVLVELEGLVQEFAAFDPARAAVLDVVFDVVREALPQDAKSPERDKVMGALRHAGARAKALTARFPDSPDAWRLVYMTARMVGSADEAAAMVTAPLSPAMQAHPDVRLQQARALLDLGLQWRHEPMLRAALAAAADLPEAIDKDTRQQIVATLDGMLAASGDAERRKRAIEAFEDLARRTTGKEQALAHNNVGLIKALAGDAEGAVDALNAARTAAPDELTPVFNLAVIAQHVGQLEGVPEAFARAASSGDNATVRLHAYAWLVELADKGTGDRDVTRLEFQAALAKERDSEVRGQLSLGQTGVASTGEFKLSFGYSSQQGLQLIDEVVPRWWLFLPAPNIDALLKEAAEKEVAARPRPGTKPRAPKGPAR